MATSHQWSDTYNAGLADSARYGYQQAQMEGAALRGELGVNAQILALSEVYKELRAAGKMSEAAAIRAQVNEIVAKQPSLLAQ